MFAKGEPKLAGAHMHAKPIRPSRLERAMSVVERVGNALPHPFMLFSLLAALVFVLSIVPDALGASVVAPVIQGAGVPRTETLMVNSLASREAFTELLTGFVDIYVRFPPLGLAMAMMLGIGVLEQSGFVSAMLRRTLLQAHPMFVTFLLAMVGINANLASEAGVIFTITLGGAIFASLGRHPWVGVAVGYAAASGGFTANLMIAGTDALLAGITASAAKGASISAPVHPLINWYFTASATLVVASAVTIIGEGPLAHALGDAPQKRQEAALRDHSLTRDENRGLVFAAGFMLAYIGLIVLAAVPEDGLLRAPDGKLLPASPLTQGVVPLLFALFMGVGIAYGLGAKTVRSARDVPKLMEHGLRGLMSFIVVALPASMFIHLFNRSRLSSVLAAGGAQLIRNLALGRLPLLLVLVFATTTLNVFLPSGSTKWLVFAPVFVPMFASAKISPAMTQMAFRVGDSATNALCPFKSYLPVIIGLLEQHAQKPDEKVGIGTVVSLQVGFSGALLFSLTVLLVAWYLLGLPLGPGVPVLLP
jgi:aminobenzoyl-glutamate transport protein